MKDWNYIGWSFDSDSFEIEGIAVWRYDWQRVNGEVLEVNDHAYGQDFSFVVYQIEYPGIQSSPQLENSRTMSGDFTCQVGE